MWNKELQAYPNTEGLQIQTFGTDRVGKKLVSYPRGRQNPSKIERLLPQRGTASITTGKLVRRLDGKGVRDPFRLGCYTWHKLRWKDDIFLRILTFY
eukprot:14562732-Ditylum_brightwellii.AAC.2